MKYLKYLKYLFVIIILSLIVVISIFHYKLILISGNSMEPTLHNNSLILLEKKDTIHRNSIISFKAPKSWNNNQEKNLIKRVIAVPGDHLKIDENFVYVNGKTIARIKGKIFIQKDLNVNLNKNEYFVMGDNIGRSNDSLLEYSLGNSEFLIKLDKNKYSTEDYPYEKNK